MSAVFIQFRQYIVQEEHRVFTDHIPSDSDFRQLQCQSDGAMLSLRSVLLRVLSINQKFHIVPLRSQTAVPAIKVSVSRRHQRVVLILFRKRT